MDAIEIRNLRKTFKDRSTGEPFHAVKNVSFSIPQGAFFTLLGPSGCGKTTILRMIAGFEPPSSGEILAMGKPITELAPEKRDLPVVFQNYALFPHMTVFDNVAYSLRVKKWKKDQMETRVGETLEIMGLKDLAQRRPDEMSGGQQQRVALARALVSKPRIVLFDEPLSNLDAKLREEMRIELKRLQRQFGLTALYVTHDQEEAMALSDQVIIMRKGEFEQIGTPKEIYFRPASRFVADFIGKANFIPAKARKNASGYEVNLWDKTLHGVMGHEALKEARDENCEVVIRPEGVLVDSKKRGEFRGKLTHLGFLGSKTLCEIDILGQRILAESDEDHVDSSLRIGQEIEFSLDPRKIYAIPKQG